MAAATTSLTKSPLPSITIEQPLEYGCDHIESILKKHGDRVRRGYDQAMSVVIQPSSKAASVKVHGS